MIFYERRMIIMKLFETPAIEVIKLQAMDVIATSVEDVCDSDGCNDMGEW